MDLQLIILVGGLIITDRWCDAFDLVHEMHRIADFRWLFSLHSEVPSQQLFGQKQRSKLEINLNPCQHKGCSGFPNNKGFLGGSEAEIGVQWWFVSNREIVDAHGDQEFENGVTNRQVLLLIVAAIPMLMPSGVGREATPSGHSP